MSPMDGKTALVTGASAGIGRAIAKRFADDGARVYITGRRADELEAAAKDIGPNAVPVPSDVSRAADLDRVIDVIRGDGRRLDVVVANAGLGDGSSLTDVTEEQFDHVFGVNTKGSLLTVQKALPLLAETASVILLGSTTIHQGVDRMGVYAASKAAVRSLGRTWAAELAPRGVRVNVITPGPIATPAIEGLADKFGMGTEDLHGALAAQVPLRRMGRPEEVAALAAFLAGPESSFITGAEHFVDGGQVQV
ncbi:SDR family oxidoreductase [Catenulispora sp. NF23]|uniref:SDR family oxidoreductase n=1 Tax=Catenulispora pinistramenti TaxID=2705254 RepID=A0ABS5KHV9_9ACTN|nr:SDR family oxidoreductase [Catenulispora pinistramenti]MBS2532949.1 SDR family oxidoreductase [Catenulispora pinistramenti]MBS2545683.1 SDR family oxidoreductase [Catenulispora pinistramenti]